MVSHLTISLFALLTFACKEEEEVAEATSENNPDVVVGTQEGGGSGSGSASGSGTGSGSVPNASKYVVAFTGRLVFGEPKADPPAAMGGSGGKVFLKGHPETVAETDANGFFTLQLNLDSEPASNNFEAVMWHSTTTDGALTSRMGTYLPAVHDGVSGSVVSLGNEIELKYTWGFKFSLTNVTNFDEDLETNLCVFTFPGFGGHIKVVRQLANTYQYLIDYLPEGNIEYKIKCPNFLEYSGSKQIPHGISTPGYDGVFLNDTHLIPE